MGTYYYTNNTPSISSISTPSLPSTSIPSPTYDNASGTNGSTTSATVVVTTIASTIASTAAISDLSTSGNFSTTSTTGNFSNITEYCEFRGKAKIKFVNWGYEQIPQNIALNVVGWLILLLIFSLLRRKAWNHGHLALLKRISKRAPRGSNISREEELLQEEEEAFEEVQKDNAGYNVWVSLFYDPDRRFSVLHPVKKYRPSNANSLPATPSGSFPPTPRGLWPGASDSTSSGPLFNGSGAPTTPLPNGGVGSTPIPNGGAAGGVARPGTTTTVPATTANGAAAATADEVHIRITPATLLRGDGQLHNNVNNFSFSNPRGFFGWVLPIFRLKDKDYREVSGQDALNYLNFQRYCIVYLAIVMLLSCCVILPINFLGDISTRDEDFKKTTISNLRPDSKKTWWHAWVGLCYLGMAVLFMKNYMLLVEETDDEAEHSKRTVMISNINPEKCARQTIIQHFSETFPSRNILDVQVAHDIGRLIQLDYERQRALDAHAVYLEKFEKTGQRPTVRPYCCGDQFGCLCPYLCVTVDAIEYYEAEIQRIDKAHEEERQIAFGQKNLGMAFVTFEKKKSMVDVIYEHARMNTICARVRKTRFVKAESSVADALHVKDWRVVVAPSPNNIFWENLGTKDAVWWTRCFLLNLTFVSVMLGVSTPAQILTLLDKMKFSEFLNGLPSIGPVVFSQFLPTWILWLFAVLLPVLIYYVGWFEGHPTKSAFNRSVMFRSYFFLLTMLLFLPSISLTSFETAANFFFTEKYTPEEKKKKWECIFLPHNGAFFVNYVTTAAFVGTGMELCRFPELFMYSMRLLSARSAAERHTVKRNQPYSYDYGNHYAWFLCIFAITMAYSISCPLITPIGLIYAILKHLVDRHNIYFAYDPAIVKKELHVTATNFMLLAVIFTQCNLLFFQLWRSELINPLTKIINPLTIFTVIAMCVSGLVFMGWVSWGWFDNVAQNKYKRWVRRFPKHSVNDDNSIIDDSDASSPADEDDEDEDTEENFVFVPRPPPSQGANDSFVDDASVEETSPFSSDVAVRRRTMERIDSMVSVGSRNSLVNTPFEAPTSVVSSQPHRTSIVASTTFPERMARPLSSSTISTRSSMRMPKLSVTSSLDFDERDEEELFEPSKQRRTGTAGVPVPRPFPSPTQPPPVISGSLPTTPSFVGVTNYGATDASDYPIAHRPSITMHLELQETPVGAAAASSTASQAPSPSGTSSSSSSIAAAIVEMTDNSKSKSPSRSQTPAPQNEGFED